MASHENIGIRTRVAAPQNGGQPGAWTPPPRPGILAAIGNTPLVEMPHLSPKAGVRLFAKLEGNNPTGSVKDRIALHMIEAAEAEGKLTPNKIILEPTSGNTGIGLAMVGKLKGYRVEVVMPKNVSPERVQLLQAFDAQVHFSDWRRGTNGSIAMAQKMVAEHSGYFMPYQYGNAANPLAHYHGTAAEIIRDLPEVDVFVAGLGTGGTLMGNGRRLKEHNPNVKIVAAAPQPDEAISGLRALEDGFIPPILDLSLLDARIMISSEESFKMAKELLHKEGIFAGVSSGAVVACALKVARRMEKGNVVCLLADGGWKYLSTGLWSKTYSDLEMEVQGKVWW
ncbi:MAG: cysteine synthase family protein [Chloroflexi bacterium]|nr:cysteine synthase family protein [Chloroflexota bacterium]